MMRYPNLRYGNPAEFRHYAQGLPVKEIARRLRRSERSIRDWLSGAERLPWWVPEILRLQMLEHALRMQQMGMQATRARLGLVEKTAIVYQFSAASDTNSQAACLPCSHDEHCMQPDLFQSVA
jgi:hypothetical protein